MISLSHLLCYYPFTEFKCSFTDTGESGYRYSTVTLQGWNLDGLYNGYRESGYDLIPLQVRQVKWKMGVINGDDGEPVVMIEKGAADYLLKMFREVLQDCSMDKLIEVKKMC